jgi:hypothetical protein
MIKIVRKCIPCCVRPKLSSDDADNNKTDQSSGAQQPLSDFFKSEELLVLGDLAFRVKVVIDSTLPATLHGTSSVVNGIPLAIVNHRYLSICPSLMCNCVKNSSVEFAGLPIEGM